MKFLSTAVIACIIVCSCTKHEPRQPNVPPAINTLVWEFRQDTLLCSNASVKEFLFQEEAVYLFNWGSCIADASTIVYDADGNHIGSLWGWSGNTINGVPFSEHSAYVRTVWRNIP